MPPRHRPLLAATVYAATAFLFPSAAATNLPRVDLQRMGTVAVAGAFAGFDLYDPSKNVTFDPTTATLLLRAQDGSLSPLADTNPGGSIAAACSLDGKLYFAGLFSNVAGVAAQNIASYDPATATLSPLGGQNAGLNGQVQALYCDPSTHTLWAGGKFTAPTSASPGPFGPAVARYSTTNGSWFPAPFVGLAGAASEVLSITPTVAATSLLFAGSFLTQFGSNAISQNISNPNVPSSSGATPFTTSLVPVALSNAQVVGTPSTSTAGYNNVTNILCPAGNDGPGHSWRAQDGVPSVVIVRAYRFITASGIRIGNTFVDGRGAKTFSITAIPNNFVIQLTYIDPVTKQYLACSDACPLGNNASVPYQDFLFPSALVITGFQINISAFYGAGAGLHILQLLSTGAFASAVAGDNTPSCYAPGASAVALTGQWTTVNACTDIAGTTQNILTTSVNVGTSSAAAPSVTWYPYVSASGEYDVYLMVPGCQNLQDCANRTSVKVTVNPGGGLQPVVTTVSEQVTVDTNQLVYTGPIYPEVPSYNSTVTLTLADSPAGMGSNGKYDLVADRVEFILTSTTIANAAGVANGTGTGAPGFGLYEWPLAAANVNATGVLPNTTITTLDKLSSALYSALGSAAATTPFSIHAVAPYAADSVIFAGQFSLATVGAVNVAAYSGGSIIAVGGTGLNGIVTAMAPTTDKSAIFIGGAFTDTANANNGRYRGIVKYDVASSSWTALGGGVDGVVSGVSLAGNQVNIAGNFTHVFGSTSDTTGSVVGGFATFDLASGAWVNSGGFLVGTMTMAVAGDGNTTAQYIAGNVAASSQYGAGGWAILENGSNGQPIVSSTGTQLGSSIAPGEASAARAKRRHGWFTRAASHVFPNAKRQATTASLPTSTVMPAPAVLTGAFWTNSSTMNEVVILGGNFSVGSSGSGVALYDAGSKTLHPLQGNQVDGVVRSLYVSGNTLFVGGDFSVTGVDGRGLGMYQLDTQQWTQPYQALQASSGSTVVVRSLGTSPAISNTVIVAGTFATAGSVPCEAICSWDVSGKQWHALGDGIHGDVASVDYAGSKLDTIVVGGALTLADGTAANVALYSIGNSTWRALGATPGPVTAVGVNDHNSSSIFAAGRSSTGGAPFLVHWNGSAWSAQESSWIGSTSISQLKFVPLQDTHSSNGVIQSDRMLMICGAIDSSSQGMMSSALFDGQAYYPYLVTSSADGSPGVVSALFNSISSFGFGSRKFLATGIVILISFAIATGIVFLILLIGILLTLCARREIGPADPNLEDDDDDDDNESSFRHHRPSSLLAHINAATRTTILGTSGAMAYRKGDASQDTHDPDAWARADTPSEALGAGGIAGDSDVGDVNRPTHARYSFAGGAEGELPVAAGQEVLVLDDRDQAWWYVRDPATGREGVVPASYLY